MAFVCVYVCHSCQNLTIRDSNLMIQYDFGRIRFVIVSAKFHVNGTIHDSNITIRYDSYKFDK